MNSGTENYTLNAVGPDGINCENEIITKEEMIRKTNQLRKLGWDIRIFDWAYGVSSIYGTLGHLNFVARAEVIREEVAA